MSNAFVVPASLTPQTITIEFPVPPGPRLEIYGLDGDPMRLADGGTLWAVYVVQRPGEKSLEGVYLYYVPPSGKYRRAQLLPLRSEEAPEKPPQPRPLTKFHGALVVGQAGAVHFACLDDKNRRGYFINLLPPGSAEIPAKA